MGKQLASFLSTTNKVRVLGYWCINKSFFTLLLCKTLKLPTLIAFYGYLDFCAHSNVLHLTFKSKFKQDANFMINQLNYHYFQLVYMVAFCRSKTLAQYQKSTCILLFDFLLVIMLSAKLIILALILTRYPKECSDNSHS